MPRLDFADYVEIIRSESQELARAAESAGLRAPVPSYPGWTVSELLGHKGRAQRWVLMLIESRDGFQPGEQSEIVTPPHAQRQQWFEEGAETFAVALEMAGPDAEVFSWTDEHTTTFWARRQAFETAIHRRDAQLAAGMTPDPINRDLAIDAIDNLLEVLSSQGQNRQLRGEGETIHLHCTDGEGEWLLTFTPSGMTWSHEHAKGTLAARGTASDLLLLLYGRIAPDAVEVFGDASLLALWQEQVRF